MVSCCNWSESYCWFNDFVWCLLLSEGLFFVSHCCSQDLEP